MNDGSRVGFRFPSGAVPRGLIALLMLPTLTMACDILGPSEGFVLEPFQTTWLSEPAPIDPATHPPEDPAGEVLIDSLFYRADLMVFDTALGTEPMSLAARVTLRNPFDDPVTIQVPGCPWRVRAYATIDRVDPPIWSATPNEHGDFLGIGCSPGIFDVTVPPQSGRTGGTIPVLPQFMGRGLLDGRRYFTVEYHRVDEEPILLRAGSADMRLQEPGLEFDVSLEERNGEVHVDVRLTNRNDVPVPVLWGHCSLNPVLFHDAARTNLAREFPINCFSNLRSATLAPGETIHPEFEFVRDFDPGDVLDLPSGTYFLSVRVMVNWFDYFIPAGEIRLR